MAPEKSDLKVSAGKRQEQHRRTKKPNTRNMLLRCKEVRNQVVVGAHHRGPTRVRKHLRQCLHVAVCINGVRVGRQAGVHLRGVVVCSVLRPRLLGNGTDAVRTCLRAWIHEIVRDRARQAEVLRPQRQAERTHVTLVPTVRLVQTDGDLGVAVACHGAVVDVARADNHVLVVHNQHLRVHVDGKATAVLEHGTKAFSACRWVGGLFPLRKAQERQVVCRVCAALLRLQCLGNALVHVRHRLALPEQNLLLHVLKRGRFRVSLRKQRQDDVRHETCPVVDSPHDAVGEDHRHAVRRRHRVARLVVGGLPPERTTHEVLVFNVHEALRPLDGADPPLVAVAHHPLHGRVACAADAEEQLRRKLLVLLLVHVVGAAAQLGGVEQRLVVTLCRVAQRERLQHVVCGRPLHLAVDVLPRLPRPACRFSLGKNGVAEVAVEVFLPPLCGVEQTLLGCVPTAAGDVKPAHKGTHPTLRVVARLLGRSGAVADHRLLVVCKEEGAPGQAVRGRSRVPLRRDTRHLRATEVVLRLFGTRACDALEVQHTRDRGDVVPDQDPHDNTFVGLCLQDLPDCGLLGSHNLPVRQREVARPQQPRRGCERPARQVDEVFGAHDPAAEVLPAVRPAVPIGQCGKLGTLRVADVRRLVQRHHVAPRLAVPCAGDFEGRAGTQGARQRGRLREADGHVQETRRVAQLLACCGFVQLQVLLGREVLRSVVYVVEAGRADQGSLAENTRLVGVGNQAEDEGLRVGDRQLRGVLPFPVPPHRRRRQHLSASVQDRARDGRPLQPAWQPLCFLDGDGVVSVDTPAVGLALK
eukprot:Rhum_TRINITY_DN9610_c0_g2::Rhum_TRINITY_DN9610_c0_g2_i1::g.34369::m.34369